MISVGGMRNFFNRFGNGCVLILLGAFALSLIINYGSNGLGNRGAREGNASAETVIATVNGDQITEADFRETNARLQANQGATAPGKPFADRQGETMQSLISSAIIAQEAKRRNAHPLEADIDKQVDGAREAVGRNLNKTKISDQEFSDFLMTNRGLSVADFRQLVAKSLVPMALFNIMKADEKVTEAEARNQTAQVHLKVVNVPYQDAATPPMLKPKMKPLTEAEAKAKAEALYARVKGGADISAVEKTNADDPASAKNGGDIPMIAEYPANTPGQFSVSLKVQFGSDFAEAVHKLMPGQTSDLMKMTGFQKGYGFAKLIERKVNTPKDFDAKKAVAALAEQRAGEKLEKLVKSLTKSAKIEFKDPDKKAYYDYKQLDNQQNDFLRDMMSGVQSTPPSKAETDAQQAVINKEFEDLLKRHPDDTTAAIIVADSIKQHRPLESGAQDRLIALNETIVKNNDDFDRHFELADSYREKKDYAKAKVHLDRIAKLSGYNTPYDLAGYKAADEIHRKLETAYRSINETAAAEKEKAASDALQPKIMLENVKLKEEERKARAAGKNGSGGNMSIPGMEIPAGGSSQPMTITPSPASGTRAETVPSKPAAPKATDSKPAKNNAPTVAPDTKRTAPTPGTGH